MAAIGALPHVRASKLERRFNLHETATTPAIRFDGERRLSLRMADVCCRGRPMLSPTPHGWAAPLCPKNHRRTNGTLFTTDYAGFGWFKGSQLKSGTGWSANRRESLPR